MFKKKRNLLVTEKMAYCNNAVFVSYKHNFIYYYEIIMSMSICE